MQVRCSDGTTRTLDDTVVDRLVDHATTLGVESGDLDDLVHDCCDATASRRANGDPDLPDDILAAQDVAYADASRIGSQVNNQGLRAQVAFLVAELGDAPTAEALTLLAS